MKKICFGLFKKINDAINEAKETREEADLFWVFAFGFFVAMSFASVVKVIVNPKQAVAYAVALIICSLFAYVLHLSFDIKGFFEKENDIKQ